MSAFQKIEEVTDFLQESVENVINTTEHVHQTVLDVPVELLKVVGLPEEKAEKLKEKQHKLAGSVYEAIRATNRQVGSMANQICEGANESIEAIQHAEIQTPPTDIKVPGKTAKPPAGKKTS